MRNKYTVIKYRTLKQLMEENEIRFGEQGNMFIISNNNDIEDDEVDSSCLYLLGKCEVIIDNNAEDTLPNLPKVCQASVQTSVREMDKDMIDTLISSMVKNSDVELVSQTMNALVEYIRTIVKEK